MIHTPKFPLQIGDRSLFEKTDEIKQVIMFHLKNLILTYPGEKISDPFKVLKGLFSPPIASIAIVSCLVDIKISL